MTLVHTLSNRAILRPAQSDWAWIRGEMRESQGEVVAYLRDLPWRRGALRVGYLVLVFAGLELLAASNGVGVVYVLAGAAGMLLAHRRVYPVLVWSGVAVHGAWLVVGGDQTGLWGVAGGALEAVVGYLPDSAIRPPKPLLEGLESALGAVRGLTAEAPLEAAVATAESVPAPPAPHPVTVVEIPHAAQVVETPAAVSPTTLVIHSIGRFQLLVGDRDLTEELTRMSVLRFTWLYLMAVQVLSEAFQTREETAPRVTPPRIKDPKGRLRDQLRDIKEKLPQAIARPIVTTTELVRFDPEGCDWDVLRLRHLLARCLDWGGEVVPRELLPELERELAALAPGEFLPGWDALERHALNGNPNEDLIRDIRLKVGTLRADLTAILGSSLLAHGRAKDAIAPLEAELARSGDPRIVENLIKALHETGQHDRAAELRRKYDQGEI
jgi:hypothetical protein